MQLSTVFKSFRPSFLVLTPVCIFLGLSLSLAKQPDIDWLQFILIMLGALFAHISVNTLNEYYDFKSGLDLQTEKTPFSGGSGALPDNPESANAVLIVGIISLVLSSFVGIYFISQFGLDLLPLGLAGLLLVVTYTQWINRMPIMCLAAPGLGFGVLMVVGSFWVITGSYTDLPWLITLVPFFLINNLLLLNQYPDIKADQNVGRNTFPIAFGVDHSNKVYALFLLVAYLLIIIEVINGQIPMLSLIALLPAILGLFSLTGALKYKARIANYPQYLGANVAAAILTPLLLAIAIFMA